MCTDYTISIARGKVFLNYVANTTVFLVFTKQFLNYVDFLTYSQIKTDEYQYFNLIQCTITHKHSEYQHVNQKIYTFKIFPSAILVLCFVSSPLFILPIFDNQHQQQVAAAVERAKQVTMTELNAIIGVSIKSMYKYISFLSILM